MIHMRKILRFVLTLTTGCFLFLSISSGQSVGYEWPEGISSSDYMENTLIIKVKEEYRDLCSMQGLEIPALDAIFAELEVDRIQKKFPGQQQPEKRYNSKGFVFADLSLIYEVHYEADVHVSIVMKRLMASGVLQYAEPHIIPKPLYIPNDPANADTLLPMKRYYLERIRAFDAWDLHRGDSSVVVGNVDSGTDTDHPDLKDNIYYNFYDPIDSLDNDNDGYVDNYMGWDLGMGDNDPNAFADLHGIHMSGLASARTDNAVGISGTGFHCKYLPVKIDNEYGHYIYAYEGIVYAADHGCDVIVCAWGSIYGKGQYGQDIIDYATINRDVLLVAAAGNDNDDGIFYPASNKYVLSVGGSNKYDEKSGLSNYGYYLDLVAPADSVYSTWNNGNYLFSSGTSMAASITGGAAALLRSYFPGYDALQIGEKLKVSADDIDTITANSAYNGLLGSGRLNIFNALSDTSLPSIEFMNYTVMDNNGGMALNGDTISINGDFFNHLFAVNSLSVNISCLSNYLLPLNNTANFPLINGGSAVSNASQKFYFRVIADIPPNQSIYFKLEYSAYSYSAHQYFKAEFTNDLVDIITPRLKTTITSKGRLGYDDYLNTKGLGFVYNNNGQSVLFNGGLLIGVSSLRVSDNTFNASAEYNNDFMSVVPAQKVSPPVFSDHDVQGVFNDDSAGISKLNVNVVHHAYAWDNQGEDQFVIYEYEIINDGLNTLNDLYAGLITDWDIANWAKNHASYDHARQLGYSYTNEILSLYVGIKLLDGNGGTHYAFDFNGADGSINLSDGYTDYEKYEILRGNEVRDSAGFSGDGNNVLNQMNVGPYNLQPGDTAKIAFALVAGDHLAELQQMADLAESKFFNTNSVSENLQSTSGDHFLPPYPNPASKSVCLDFYLSASKSISYFIYDHSGKQVAAGDIGMRQKGRNRLTLAVQPYTPGLYVISLKTEGYTHNFKFLVAE